jgi:hypothetical protein
LAFAEKPKLTYQEDGLELQKFSFRPDDVDWFELGIFWRMVVEPVETEITTTTADLGLIHKIFGKKRYIHRILHFRL